MALRKLSQVRGDSQTYTITFKDADGNLYNIKNWAVTFTLKDTHSLPDSAAVLQKTFRTFSDTTSGTSGVAVITLTPSDTVNIDPGEYDFDIQICTSLGENFTILRGKYDLEFDVTRTTGTAGTAA